MARNFDQGLVHNERKVGGSPETSPRSPQEFLASPADSLASPEDDEEDDLPSNQDDDPNTQASPDFSLPHDGLIGLHTWSFSAGFFKLPVAINH